VTKRRFDDKIIMITGAAGAIGAAAVRRFIEEGGKVALIDKDAEAAQNLAAEFGERAKPFITDVSKPQQVETMVDSVVAHFGHIDVLFNNAGISGTVTPIYELSLAAWQQILDTNLNGIFYVLRATLRAMIATKRQGAIVNMSSSIAGWDVLAGGVGYAASKFGITGITRVAALDCAPYGIRVNAICPGVIKTRLGVPAHDEAAYQAASRHFSNRIPLRRIGQPEDVAALVAFLSCEEARHITGIDWLIDGGQTLQSFPKSVKRFSDKNLRSKTKN